ncbi:hypothetical protein ARSEF4850_008240 [Beauveria asiatica]
MASAPDQPIALRPMRHQSYVQRPKEDWAGITDQKTRKRLQNRLNHTNKEEATNEEEEDEFIARVVVQNRALLARFALEATRSYVTNRPDTDQLLRVVKLNTINALTANATALQLPGDWLMCRAISPFGLAGPLPVPLPVTTAGAGRPPRQQPRSCYPASLTPTPLQLPRMRDNWLLAIYVQERLVEEDEVRLWDDLSGGTVPFISGGEFSLMNKTSFQRLNDIARQQRRGTSGDVQPSRSSNGAHIVKLQSNTPPLPLGSGVRDKRQTRGDAWLTSNHRGEQTAAQLEANLTNLEFKLDAMLAAFEQQGGQGPGQGSAGDKTSSNSNGGSNSST